MFKARKTRQQGLAMVEFSISMLLIIFLLMVAVELGRMLFSYTILTQQVRAGARYASLNALTPALALDLPGVRPATQQVVVTGQAQNGTSVLSGLTADNVSVDSIFPSGAAKPHIVVTAAYAYTPIFPVIPNFWTANNFSFNTTFTSTATMRAIR